MRVAGAQPPRAASPVRPLAVVALMVAAGLALAQYRGEGGRRSREDRGVPDWERGGVPNWTVDTELPDDVFTFVRVRYGSWSGGWGRRRGRGGGWRTDYPDSDLNFSFRLQQLTSIEVDPRGRVVGLTDDELFDYPFLYMLEPGRLYFEPAEVEALRRYLLAGGFLMVDDFWGDDEWQNFEEEILRVFPDRRPVDVPLDHDIFHCVYDLSEKPQIPSINVAWWGRDSGVTWEGGADTVEPHYRAIYDDDGRMMVFICHNTDLGDGWEREGEDEWYFREFSEKKAYPLGINIVVYALTH